MAYLSVNDLTIAFDTREGRTLAVDRVSFSVEKGQILGVVGESGSGKSVACYSVMGLLPMPPANILSGSITFDQKNLLAMSEQEMRSLRGNKVAMIFQDPMTSLNPFMTVAHQLTEALIVQDKMAKDEARRKAVEALIEVGISDAQDRIDAYPHQFSGGMRQRVMIAMALIKEPEVLIADEPTTALDVTVQAQILSLLKKLQEKRNLTVIFISHDLGVVAGLADNLIVMEKGRIVESGEAGVVLRKPQHPYTRKLVAAIPNQAKSAPRLWNDSTEDVLSVNGLTKVFGSPQNLFSKMFKAHSAKPTVAVNDVSFRLKKGEVLGLVGESGSGKSTIGKSIMRFFHVDSGEVKFNGVDILMLQERALRPMRRDFQMIFQDPYASLNPRMTVFDILVEPMKVHGIVPQSELLEEVNRLMDDVGLGRETIRKYPHEFSGGQRQRIAIARALAIRPKLIIADEPVSALDVTVQSQILELLLKLTIKYQLSMLFISHDLFVVRYLCDRVMVLKEGRVVEQGEVEDVFSNPQQEYTKKLIASAVTL